MIALGVEGDRLYVMIKGVRYEFTDVTLPDASWSCRLKADGIGSRAYTVKLCPLGWRCTCADATKGRAKRLGYDCKHTHASYELAAILGVKLMAPKVKPADPAADDLIRRKLRNPFHPDEVKFKPQTFSGDKKSALAVAYIDARAVMDRLDEVVGPSRWKDQYRQLPDGTVVCTLSILFGDEWVPKEDVGGESEQPDEHDRRKASFSDALKRCAVKFGIGRYLYHLPKQWCEYDQKKRQFVRTPKLPDWAMPGTIHEPPPPPRDDVAEEEAITITPTTQAPTQAPTHQPTPNNHPAARVMGDDDVQRAMQACHNAKTIQVLEELHSRFAYKEGRQWNFRKEDIEKLDVVYKECREKFAVPI